MIVILQTIPIYRLPLGPSRTPGNHSRFRLNVYHVIRVAECRSNLFTVVAQRIGKMIFTFDGNRIVLMFFHEHRSVV